MVNDELEFEISKNVMNTVGGPFPKACCQVVKEGVFRGALLAQQCLKVIL